MNVKIKLTYIQGLNYNKYSAISIAYLYGRGSFDSWTYWINGFLA